MSGHGDVGRIDSPTFDTEKEAYAWLEERNYSPPNSSRGWFYKDHRRAYVVTVTYGKAYRVESIGGF